MECLTPPPALKKHRDRQRACRGLFMICSICHLFIGIWLAIEKCVFGWHVIGFTLFGVFLIREKSISGNAKILWGQQCLLFVMTIHALWHYNESRAEPLSILFKDHKISFSSKHDHVEEEPYVADLIVTKSNEGSDISTADILRERVLEDQERKEANQFDNMKRNDHNKDDDDDENLNKKSNFNSKKINEETQKNIRQLKKKEKFDRQIQRREETKSKNGESGGMLSRLFGGFGGGGSSSGGGRQGKYQGRQGGPMVPDPEIPLGFKDDLARLTPQQIQRSHRQLFEDLPIDGFDPNYKNPCWSSSSKQNRLLLSYQDEKEENLLQNHSNVRGLLSHRPSSHRFAKRPSVKQEDDDAVDSIQCLPYVYLLGMPKCGSSDMWERLARHPQVQNADRKETRFFTPGEFSAAAPDRGFLPPETPLSDFTRHHGRAAAKLKHERQETGQSHSIVIDGGPHTLWWSIQDPTGQSPLAVKDPKMTEKEEHENKIQQLKHKFGNRYKSEHVKKEDDDDEGYVTPAPIASLVSLLQPKAKLLITLAEPVRRMYSDYYFLLNDGVAMGTVDEGKTPEDFHAVASGQTALMIKCFAEQSGNLELTQAEYLKDPSLLPIEAEQACAYDRSHFGRPGTGRIAIGLYHAFIHKWFEYYPRNQFLILRLEDFNEDPQRHLTSVFDFLGLDIPLDSDWKKIMIDKTFNEHRSPRPSMLPETEVLLKSFYQPFNIRLSNLLLPGGDVDVVKNYNFKPSSSPLSKEEEGVMDAKKFLWEDTYEKKNANVPIMQSKWLDGNKGLGRSRRPAIDDKLDPKRLDRIRQGRGVVDERGTRGVIGAVGTRGVLKNEDRREPGVEGDDNYDNSLPDPPPILDDRSRKREKFGLRGQVEDVERRGGRVDRSKAPTVKGGRNGLMDLPDDLLLRNEGSTALCLASMGLHKEALNRYLSTPGVSAQAVMADDRNRNALHCLSSVWIFGDSLRESMLTHLLGGRRMENKEDHWIEQLLDPPVQHGLGSYSLYHITNGTLKIAAEIATILLEHGADPSAQDHDGRSPLYFAAIGGMDSVVEVLLEHGSNVHLLDDRYEQTPLHVCATHGHAKIASLLIKAGADAYLKDLNGNSFYDMATAVGSAISPSDLKTYLGWEKQPQKLLSAESAQAMWLKHGDGGWHTDSLESPYAERDYSADPKCGVDMLNGSIVTGEEILNKYMYMNRPVLIRGLGEDSPAWTAFTMKHLKKQHGDLEIHVSDIPYNEKFGSHNGVDETLGEYIDEMMLKKGSANLSHPWYAFRGHPVGRADTGPESLVPIEDVPIPKVMGDTFSRFQKKKSKGKNRGGGKEDYEAGDETSGSILSSFLGGGDSSNEKAEKQIRSAFVNMQWALGTKGSGAPVHFHNVAWNHLFYGRKHWLEND